MSLTAATMNASYPTKRNISITWSPPSGASGTVHNHVWRYEGRFTTTGVDLGEMSGPTVTSFVDTTAELDRVYSYELHSQDNVSSVVSNRITTSRTVSPADLYLGWIGDSNYTDEVAMRTAGYNIAQQGAFYLSQSLGQRPVHLTNQAHGGSALRDWLPGSTYYNAAVSAFNAAGITACAISHGTNDTNHNGTGQETPATFRNKLSTIIGNLMGAVPSLGRVVIVSPIYLWVGDSDGADERNALLAQYNRQSAGLDNGTTVRFAGVDSFTFTAQHPEWFPLASPDFGVHLNDAGGTAVGQMVGGNLARALFDLDLSPVQIGSTFLR